MALHYKILTPGGEVIEEDDGSVNYVSAQHAHNAGTARAEQLKSQGNIPDDGEYTVEVSES